MSRRDVTHAPLLDLKTVRTVDSTRTVGGKQELNVVEQPITRADAATGQGRARLWWKRPLDVVVSAVLLILLAPLLGALTLLIRLESSGPAFYRQERVGLDGQLFTMF